MTDRTSTPRTGDVSDGIHRRRLLRGTAGAVAAGGLLGGAGGVAAQENDSDGTTDETAFANAAISDDVPTLGSGDYSGLFLQIEKPEDMGNQPDVSGCGFIDSEAGPDVATFASFLISRGDSRTRSERIALYANAGETEIAPGKLFIINQSRSCPESEGVRQLKLESIGASRIEPQVRNGSGGGTGQTGGSIPGFGPVTALGGLAAAAGAAALQGRRRRGDED